MSMKGTHRYGILAYQFRRRARTKILFPPPQDTLISGEFFAFPLIPGDTTKVTVIQSEKSSIFAICMKIFDFSLV